MRAETVITPPARLTFVRRVTEAFEEAGVSYTMLHDATAGPSRDSDLDLAVGRDSRETVDAIIRTGTFGRLLQRFDYDVPWCRYYVIESREPGRRYRQLDVACDPWGISRYGHSIRIALSHSAVTENGIRAPEPAATCLYLSVKRARKGLRNGELGALAEAFARDPIGSRVLLVERFGVDGHMLADDLGSGRDPERSLSQVVHRLDQISMTLRARQIGFQLSRALRRLASPTGLVVGVVGPDGAGKSTLAAALDVSAAGVFRRVVHRHVGPGLLPPPSRVLGRPTRRVDTPHAQHPSSRLGSLARIGYLAADSAVGWLPRIAYPKARSSLVVLERGFLDLAVDPRRYRLAAGVGLVRALARVLPSPDVTLFLEADPARVHERKPELPVREIERQCSAWRRLLQRVPAQSMAIPADSEETTLEHALDVVADQLAARQLEISRFDVAMRCVGRSHVTGEPFSLLTARGRPRWIIPRRRGGVGPIGAGLYRAASPRHAVGARVLGAAQRIGGFGQYELRLDTTKGLAGAIAVTLRLPSVALAAALPTDDSRTRRALLTIWHGESLVAYAKVAEAGSAELRREGEVLIALESVSLRAIETPRVLGVFAWDGLDVLLLSALTGGGRPSRRIGSVEVDALTELGGLVDRLAPQFGADADGVPQHGDFCPWNSARTRSGKLALWDWEWAHAGHPLEDWYHWHTQRFLAFGRGGAKELLATVRAPNRHLDELAATLGVPHSERDPGLIASLKEYLSRLSEDGRREREVIIEALAQLGQWQT